MKKLFYQIVTILPMFAICLMLTSCDGSGDNTGENWILAILLLLCWLKGK
mgnify:CR=1 FL=1